MGKYRAEKGAGDSAGQMTGVLLVNLGTPDAPTPAALRRYLAEFLSDPRVIETPPWLWRPILHGVVLRFRPRRSAEAYGRIWTEAGSPLLVNSLRLEDAMAERMGAEARVGLAMRYGNPSVARVLDGMLDEGLQRLVVLPLYPQYSGATTGSTFDAVAAVLERRRWVPELHFVSHYYDEPAYIAALAASVDRHQAGHGSPDRLLFSFHGLPRKYALAGDPYEYQCWETARLVAERLGLDENDWAVAFQSRFGPLAWLKPYTDRLLLEWARAGLGHVQVICPGFAADCLETLEEIAILNRERFLSAGGREFSYIPALNDHADHVEALLATLSNHGP